VVLLARGFSRRLISMDDSFSIVISGDSLEFAAKGFDDKSNFSLSASVGKIANVSSQCSFSFGFQPPVAQNSISFISLK
jgi:hypothetical protein